MSRVCIFYLCFVFSFSCAWTWAAVIKALPLYRLTVLSHAGAPSATGSLTAAYSSSNLTMVFSDNWSLGKCWNYGKKKCQVTKRTAIMSVTYCTSLYHSCIDKLSAVRKNIAYHHDLHSQCTHVKMHVTLNMRHAATLNNNVLSSCNFTTTVCQQVLYLTLGDICYQLLV